MAKQKSISYWVIMGACAVISIASLVNVYGDNKDVENRAQGLGCPEGVRCQLTQMDRSPFAQTFQFTFEHKKGTPGASTTATIRCARGAVLFGEYTCEKK